jgi:hypothetical protein
MHLTKITEAGEASSDRPATECEIEVTPAMIEAGVDVFYDLPELLGPGEEALKEAVKLAFLAMYRASGKVHCGIRTRGSEAL